MDIFQSTLGKEGTKTLFSISIKCDFSLGLKASEWFRQLVCGIGSLFGVRIMWLFLFICENQVLIDDDQIFHVE